MNSSDGYPLPWLKKDFFQEPIHNPQDKADKLRFAPRSFSQTLENGLFRPFIRDYGPKNNILGDKKPIET